MIPFNLPTVARGIVILLTRAVAGRLGLRPATADNPPADLTPRPAGQPSTTRTAESASGGAEDIRARLSDAPHPAPSRPPMTPEEGAALRARIAKNPAAELRAAFFDADGQLVTYDPEDHR